MSAITYKLEYDEQYCTLWVRIGKKRYMLTSASGELVAAPGKDISDYYWSSVPGSAEDVRNILRAIAGDKDIANERKQEDKREV